MKLVDVHAHLETKRFDKDREDVISRAKEKNILIIQAGVNPQTNRKTLEFSKKYDNVLASFGIYPIDALVKETKEGESEDFARDVRAFDIDDELGWIEEHKDECVAIGEVGLDYNWPDFSEMKNEQKENFEKILKLAKKIDKPVVVHSRKAELDAIEILEKNGMKRVVMHCFNGKKSLIRRCVDNGWFFSVPAVISRLEHFRTLVEIVPLEQLLTETDAPYLSPVAGKRNEPANVEITIKEIAKIKDLSEEEVADQIFNNAKSLFKL